MSTLERLDRGIQLEQAATDLSYAARQLDRAANYLRSGNDQAAADSLSRACEGFDRAGVILLPVDAEPVEPSGTYDMPF